MAECEVTELKNGLLVECKCGREHKIIVDEENDEIKVTSKYIKPENEDDGKTTKRKTSARSGGLFGRK